MRWMLILPTLALLGTTGASAGLTNNRDDKAETEQRLSKALAGLTPVEKSDCINLHDARSSDRIGNTILYKVSRRLIYRTDTSGGCFGLDNGDAIVTRSFGSQLCRGDIASTVDLVSHFQTGSCAIGEFTKYRAQ